MAPVYGRFRGVWAYAPIPSVRLRMSWMSVGRASLPRVLSGRDAGGHRTGLLCSDWIPVGVRESRHVIGDWMSVGRPSPRVSVDTEAKPTPPVHVAAATRPRQLPPFGVPVGLARP
jgi:hypothetical protein